MLSAYFAILVFMVFAVLLGVIALSMGKILGKRSPSAAKDGPYECGFDALDTTRLPFDVRYYLVAILFILVKITASLAAIFYICSLALGHMASSQSKQQQSLTSITAPVLPASNTKEGASS